jgi:hypothetical protein
VGDSVGVGGRLHGKVLVFGALYLILKRYAPLLAEWFVVASLLVVFQERPLISLRRM